MCAPYVEKSKPTFCSGFLKRSSVHLSAVCNLQVCLILTDFDNFCTAETGKMYETGHAFTYLLLKESVVNDVTNVSLFAGPTSVVNHAIYEWRRHLSASVGR